VYPEKYTTLCLDGVFTGIISELCFVKFQISRIQFNDIFSDLYFIIF